MSIMIVKVFKLGNQATAILRALRVPLTRRSAVHMLEIWPVYAQRNFGKCSRKNYNDSVESL